MFNLLFDNTSLPMLGQVMSFAEQRQAVLADNVANINTPGYRTSDLPVEQFTGAMERALARRDAGRPRRFAPRDTRDISFRGGVRARAVEVGGRANYYDRASRGIDELMTDMAKNAIWHSTAVTLYRQQAQLLETAIRGRMT